MPFHNIDDVFRYLTFQINLHFITVSHATVVMIGADKTKCCKCSSEVKNEDSIDCSICNVWHHLHCSGQSMEEFLQNVWFMLKGSW